MNRSAEPCSVSCYSVSEAQLLCHHCTITAPYRTCLYSYTLKGDVHTLQAGKDIVAINNHLKKYPAAIDNFVDVWMVVKVGDPKSVYEWRLEAEHKSKAAGKSGMTDEQVADFVDRYMPGYVHYLPELYSSGPTTKQPGKVLTIQIEKSRQLTKEQPDQFVES